MTAHDLIRQYYGTDLDVDCGLVVRIGHAVVEAPEALLDALDEVEGAEVRVMAEDVGVIRRTRQQVADLDLENARNNPDRAVQKERVEKLYERADKASPLSNALDQASSGHEYPALDMGLLGEKRRQLKPPESR
jgi:hypothetical protein